MHKIIAIDMDGVFVDFVGGFHKLAAELHPELVPHLPDPAAQQKFYIDDCIDDPNMAKLADQLCNHPDLFGMLEAYPGALAGMRYLKEYAAKFKLDVMICSAPHKSNKASYTSKAVWIQDNLGTDWLNKTLIVRDKTVVSAVILLDDKPEPLGDYRPMWEHILMDRPYNKTAMGKARFSGWTELGIEQLVEHAAQRYETYMFGMASRGLAVAA